MERRLREIGLTTDQIHKVITTLPSEKIPLFIHKWTAEKSVRNIGKSDRLYDNVNIMKQIPYLPRVVPNTTERISCEEMNAKYQKTTQNRTDPQANLELLTVQLFGEVKDGETLSSIEKKYRKLALQFHPDKHNGDVSKFNMLTSAYNHLKNKVKASNLKFNNDSKLDSEIDQHEIFDLEPPPNELFESKFDPNLFNEYYSKNSFKKTNHGYGNWLKEKPMVTLPQKPNMANFNLTYEEHKEKVAKSLNNTNYNSQIMGYIPPDDLIETTNFCILGDENIDLNDYSGMTSKEGIKFTDLRKAHENNHIFYDKNVKNVDVNLERAFENAQKNVRSKPDKLSQSELDAIDFQKNKHLEDEENRSFRVKQNDEDISEYFRRINSTNKLTNSTNTIHRSK